MSYCPRSHRSVTCQVRSPDAQSGTQGTLEQLMAFTVVDDHARLEQVWEAIQQGWNKDAWYIRRLLTEGAVSAADRRAVFVGIEAYTKSRQHNHPRPFRGR
jgi:hypothetical protein